MNFYTSLIFILIGVGCAASGPHRSVVGESCSVNGELSCSSDCRSILLCNSNHQLSIQTCPTAKFCDPTLIDCSATTCKQLPTRIACHSFGYFPDPFDCTKYHICITDDGSNSTVVNCRSPTAYDPLLTTCTKTHEDRVCVHKPLPTCIKDFQKGPQEENPNIYYICINGIPNLYRCDPDQLYSTETGTCVTVATTTGVPSPTTKTLLPSTA